MDEQENDRPRVYLLKVKGSDGVYVADIRDDGVTFTLRAQKAARWTSFEAAAKVLDRIRLRMSIPVESICRSDPTLAPTMVEEEDCDVAYLLRVEGSNDRFIHSGWEWPEGKRMAFVVKRMLNATRWRDRPTAESEQPHIHALLGVKTTVVEAMFTRSLQRRI